MKRKIENIIIYIIFLIIIFISIRLPEILLEMQENNIQIAIYRKEGSKGNIDVEISKIYLVKAIHDMEETSLVEINSTYVIVEKNDTDTMNKFEKEILKLQNYNVIRDFKSDDSLKMKLTNKVYTKGADKYIVKAVCLDSINYHYDFDIEDKTGKILSVTMTRNNDLNNDISTEELLKNYINYLELNIIDDWEYEDNIMKSEKAKLEIAIIEDSKYGISKLSIHSDEVTSNNYELIKYE